MPPLPWDTIRVVASGTSNVFLAAPYMKVDAVRRILRLVSPEVDLTCVSRWRPQDLVSGVSDADCRTLCMEMGGQFRIHPSLHAKYYRFDDAILVGSANLTGAGLGYVQGHNLEVLCGPSNDLDWVSLERNLLQDSRLVCDEEFAWWSGIGSFGIEASNFLPEPASPEWRPRTREPDHLWIAYLKEWDLIPGTGEQHLAELDLKDLRVPTGLNRYAFDSWIACSVLGSRFVGSVLNLWDRDRSEARTILANEWGMSVADIERHKTTAEAWLARFLR